MDLTKKSAFLALGIGFVLTGCGASSAGDEDEESIEGETQEQPIVNGRPAAAYTEAALINGDGFICSGAVIAPRVVLTAGHCTHGTRFDVVVPATRGRATASQLWTEYENVGQFVNPSSLDIGVLILDTPIDLPAYPPLSDEAVDDGTLAVNVGRINNGQASNSSLFFGREVMLSNGERTGAPFAYRSEGVIQSGDSGGPVYVGAGKSRKIVAVNSGAGGGSQVLARVDLGRSKLRELIEMSGGPGPVLTPDPVDPQPNTGCAAQESEPNDQAYRANLLGSTTCGTLTTGGDVDWYTWNVDRAGVPYEVALSAAADADVLMWRSTPWGWGRIVGRSATRFAARSVGAGSYLVAVRSPGGAKQSYSLSLKK